MAKQRDPAEGSAGRPAGGVQSIARVFDLLETMADLGGIVTLSELAQRSGLPVPTIHRLTGAPFLCR
jgi:IclR family acetate operon transcriptional repressor